MGFAKESLLGIILIISAPIIVGVFYLVGVITDLQNVIEQVLVGLILAMILVGAGLIYKGRKSKPKTSNKPNFNHVEAHLFYPKKYSLEKRDPNKHVPRQKLVLVKDLKKAYEMGDYALKLVTTGKIKSWFPEDEQNDLDEWCKKNGYDLLHEEATEEKLLEPYFEAEIKDKKQEYHLGDLVLFRTHFRGKLVHGCFHNRIVYSGGKFPCGLLHRKKDCDYSWSGNTLSMFSKWIPPFFLKGKLNGYVNYTSEWCWRVPFDAPFGQYRITMRVCNYQRPITPIEEKEDSIHALP